MLKRFLAVIILSAALSGCGYRGYVHHGSNPAPSTYDDEDNSGGGGAEVAAAEPGSFGITIALPVTKESPSTPAGSLG